MTICLVIFKKYITIPLFQNPTSKDYAGKELYEQLCRGEVTPPIEITSKLKCYYTNNSNPYLYLAPFKVEEAYHKPRILIFHDVMGDREIETIKKIAHPRVRAIFYVM